VGSSQLGSAVRCWRVRSMIRRTRNRIVHREAATSHGCDQRLVLRISPFSIPPHETLTRHRSRERRRRSLAGAPFRNEEAWHGQKRRGSRTGSGFGVWGQAVNAARFSVSYSFAPFTRNRAPLPRVLTAALRLR
jgi:hypothetical protein